MSEVLTTAQTAEYIGITVNCLRAWKSRKPDLLIEGQHWITDNNQVLWTSAGLEALQQIKGGNEPMTESVIDPLQPLQEGMTDPITHDPLQRYKPLVSSVVDAITGGLIARIDKAVTGNLKRAIATPMTPQECVTVLQDLGLKPINTELLLSANNQNLLTESKEN